MPSKELIEKVASHFEFPEKETTLVTAENILLDILAALQEPTREMYESAHKHYEGEAYLPHGLWRVMLNASSLGEQSE